MKSSVEALEGNKVKFTVEVEEAEFEKDLDVAFRALAREVRLPGFRAGKAPRKVLEARVGSEYARQEAFRAGLPNYYVDAVKEHEVDVIASPDIEIVEGETEGPVTFEAIVEIRPEVTIEGYENLTVEIPSPVVSEEDIDASVARFLGPFAELVDSESPAKEGDRITIDIEVIHEDEIIPGLTSADYVYELGLGAVVPELDDNLIDAEVGDEIEFEADHPDEDETEPLKFSITVKAIQESVEPELTDEFAAENSEFATAEELREDHRARLSETRLNQAIAARRNAVAEAVAALVNDEDLPDALVELEVDNRAQDFAMRLQSQGLSIEQYLQFTGTNQEDLLLELRSSADVSAKMDLALRAVAVAEGLEPSEDDLAAEFAQIAEQINRTPDEVREQLTNGGQLVSVRGDLAKSRALDWLVERATLTDSDGNTIDPSLLERPAEEPSGDTSDEDTADRQADDDASSGE